MNMKVVYQDPIAKRIQKAVHDAETANKRIAYIELTSSEANELSVEIRREFFVGLDPTEWGLYSKSDAGKVVGHYWGVQIRIEKP